MRDSLEGDVKERQCASVEPNAEGADMFLLTMLLSWWRLFLPDASVAAKSPNRNNTTLCRGYRGSRKCLVLLCDRNVVYLDGERTFWYYKCVTKAHVTATYVIVLNAEHSILVNVLSKLILWQKDHQVTKAEGLLFYHLVLLDHLPLWGQMKFYLAWLDTILLLALMMQRA